MEEKLTEVQDICCPYCHTALELAASTQQICPTCGCRYSIHNGIVDFSPDDHFYWGEISQDEMIHVNERAEQIGWFHAVLENVIDKSHRDLSEYLLDPRRIAGLFHFYDPDRTGTCLDLGSGWGTLAFGLSRYYGQVYSMDGVYERLRFQAIRREQENVANVRIFKGSMLKLPFLDSSMDVVIVNGLLEWIGLSDDVSDPRALQVRFLSEVYRVIKPGGKIFIGIENRFGLDEFLGATDHSGVRFTSVMPRSLANFVVKYSKRGKNASVFSGAKNCYRTLTYSSWGYRQLLREVGFTQPSIYWTWPGYNDPHASGSLDGASMKAYLQAAERGFNGGVKRSLVKMVQFVPYWLLNPFVQVFSPDFLIVASKDKHRDGLQERVLEPGSSRSFFRITPKASPDLKSSFMFPSRNGIQKIVRVTCKPSHDAADMFIAQQNEIQGHPVKIGSSDHVTAVAEWLVKFQQQGQKGSWSYSETESELTSLMEVMKRHSHHLDLHPSLDSFAAKYLGFASQTSIPIVAEHGDLSVDHILITCNREVEVVGWEHFSPTGNPLMDLGGLLLSLFPDPDRHNGYQQLSTKKDPITAFSQVYGKSMDLPIELSLAYYVLRGLKRDVGLAPIGPENYIVYRYWTKYLKPALDYAVKTRV